MEKKSWLAYDPSPTWKQPTQEMCSSSLGLDLSGAKLVLGLPSQITTNLVPSHNRNKFSPNVEPEIQTQTVTGPPFSPKVLGENPPASVNLWWPRALLG